MPLPDAKEAPHSLEGALPVPAELEQRLEEALQPLVEQRQRGKVVQVVTRVVAEGYSGPLPHPDHFDQFERVCPGTADRILTMAERQESHRMWWERFAIRAQFALAFFGLAAALTVSLALIYGAIKLGLSGHEWLGVALVAASAVGMVTAFIKGRGLFITSPMPPEDPPIPNKKQPRKKPVRRR